MGDVVGVETVAAEPPLENYIAKEILLDILF
jgi:hypothetical protein